MNSFDESQPYPCKQLAQYSTLYYSFILQSLQLLIGGSSSTVYIHMHLFYISWNLQSLFKQLFCIMDSYLNDLNATTVIHPVTLSTFTIVIQCAYSQIPSNIKHTLSYTLGLSEATFKDTKCIL